MSNAREIKQIKAGHQAGRRDAGPFALGVTILEQIPGALIGTLNGREELRNWVSRLTSLGCLGGATGLSFTGVHSGVYPKKVVAHAAICAYRRSQKS